MKSVLEMRLTEDFMAIPQLSGYVHSKFNRTMNLAFPGRLITVITAKVPGMPDSIRVCDATFRILNTLPEGMKFVKSGNQILFAGGKGMQLFLDEAILCPDTIPGTGSSAFPRRQLMDATKDFLLFNGFSRLTPFLRQKVFRQLINFCRALFCGSAAEALLACCGLGCGLTPSSDDALVGIMAACQAGLLPGAVLPDPHGLWDLLSGRTTDVSRKYLCCAAEGRFSAPLIALFDKTSGETLRQRVGAVAAVGSTSGRDTLFGIALALRTGQVKNSFPDLMSGSCGEVFTG